MEPSSGHGGDSCPPGGSCWANGSKDSSGCGRGDVVGTSGARLSASRGTAAFRLRKLSRLGADCGLTSSASSGCSFAGGSAVGEGAPEAALDVPVGHAVREASHTCRGDAGHPISHCDLDIAAQRFDLLSLSCNTSIIKSPWLLADPHCELVSEPGRSPGADRVLMSAPAAW